MLWRFGFGDILSVCVGLLRQLYIIRIVFLRTCLAQRAVWVIDALSMFQHCSSFLKILNWIDNGRTPIQRACWVKAATRKAPRFFHFRLRRTSFSNDTTPHHSTQFPPPACSPCRGQWLPCGDSSAKQYPQRSSRARTMPHHAQAVPSPVMASPRHGPSTPRKPGQRSEKPSRPRLHGKECKPGTGRLSPAAGLCTYRRTRGGLTATVFCFPGQGNSARGIQQIFSRHCQKCSMIDH